MKELKELGKELLDSRGFVPDTCGVEGCEAGDSDVVELQPLDPIDHSSTLIQLCPGHREWADARNQLAEIVTDELREERNRIGQEYLDELQELADPRGRTSEAWLMGDNSDRFADEEGRA